MNATFYTGMFLALFMLSFTMFYTIYKPSNTEIRISYFDIFIMSLILSIGVLLMYMGVIK